MGFSIKEKCEACGSTEDLDEILNPYRDEEDEMVFEQVTLCGVCIKEFTKLKGGI